MPKNDFTRKMIDFDTFTKIALEYGDFGKLNVAKAFKKCPKCKNHQIWSHWY